MAVFKNKAAVLLFKLMALLSAGALAVSGLFFSVTGGKATFDDTYQSVIRRKYQQLVTVESPKIVIVGGSNAGFGIHSPLMAEKTGYSVVNMGLHAGFGNLFNTEIAKRHVKEGDILILAYEYGLKDADFQALGNIDLIMSAIDNHTELYREIPFKNRAEILGNLFSYGAYKRKKTPVGTGVYSSNSFDEQGNMTYERTGCIIPDYQAQIDYYGQVGTDKLLIPGEDLQYLKDLKKYVEKRGASVYMTAAVLLDKAYTGTERDLLDYAAEVEKKTGIPYISNPNDYLFSEEYMYDTIYHCNDKGEIKRTEQLVADLKAKEII